MVSSSSRPLLAIGELLWDMLPAGPRLGGTTTNFAVLSARLGEFATLVSCVGEDDLGRRAVEHLGLLASEPSMHLDLRYVQTSHQLPTGTVGVVLDGEGRPQYEIVTPVAWDAIGQFPEAVDLASNASVLCFGTLAQRHIASRQSIRAFVAQAGRDCVRVCDLNLRKPFCDAEVLAWCLAHTDVLKVSDEELPEVGRLLNNPLLAAGLPADSGSELTQAAESAAREILRLAPLCRLAALTLGPHGSLLADRRGTCRHNGFRVKVVDTIGAGDAFTAGMTYAYTRQAPLAVVSEVANRCGSYVASQPGATPELPETLLACIRKAVGQHVSNFAS